MQRTGRFTNRLPRYRNPYRSLPAGPRRLAAISLWMLLLPIVGQFVLSLPKVQAASLELENRQFLDGAYSYSEIDAQGSTVKLQKGDKGRWVGDDGLTDPPFLSRDNDRDLVYVGGDMLYMVAGYSKFQTYWYRYDIPLKKWEEMAPPPTGIGYGVTMTWDKGAYIYMLPGNNTPSLFRYDIGNDSWDTMADLPSNVGRGARVTYAAYSGQTPALYAFRGNSSASLYRYDIQADSWETKAPYPASGNIDFGMDLAWPGQEKLYVLANVYTNEMRDYNLLSNTWSAPLPKPQGTYLLNRLMVQDSGTLLDMAVSIYGGDYGILQRYDINSKTWTRLADPPIGNQYDWYTMAAYDGNDTVYTGLGMYDRIEMFKYTVSQNSWNKPMSIQQPYAMWRGQIVYDGGSSAYFVSGSWESTLDKLYRFDLTNNTKTKIATTANTGTVGIYYNNALYYTGWWGYKTFQKYDLATHGWTDLAELPYAIQAGSSIVDGGDGNLYVIFGSYRRLFKYAVADNTWTELPQPPWTISAGGGAVRIDRTIYSLVGATTATLQKFDMDTNTWTVMPNTPVGSIYYGGSLDTDGTRYLYITASNRTDVQGHMFLRYDLVTGEWKRLADLPVGASVYQAGGFWDASHQRYYFSPQSDTSDLWYWEPTTPTYVSDGTWYSETLKTSNASSWGSLSIDSSGTGTVTAFTRSSSNGRLWEGWRPVSGSIASTPNPYLQVKLALHSDGTSTPTVNKVTVDYVLDTEIPDNPSQLDVLDRPGGDIHLPKSDVGYPYQHPYFSWPAATDSGGSGIDGYYVYYGEDKDADPALMGSFQTSTNYTVSVPMTAGPAYYFIIRAKDKAGNLAPKMGAMYTYYYTYISPPGSIIASSQGDFGAGDNTNVDLNTEAGAIMLKKDSGGMWTKGLGSALPDTFYGGAGAVANDYIYILRGNNSKTFWRYDRIADLWKNDLAQIPTNVGQGSFMLWDKGRYLYVAVGQNISEFWRYDINLDIWQAMSNVPLNVRSGSAAIITKDNDIYLNAADSVELFKYSVVDNSWLSVANMPFATHSTYSGSGMWYDGADDIYFQNGGPPSQAQGFAKYSISRQSWTNLAQPPTTASYTEKNLVGDGKGHLYIFRQDTVNNKTMLAMRYDIATDTWKGVPESTVSFSRGTVVSDENRYIYMLPGFGNSRQMYVYDTERSVFSYGARRIANLQQYRWNWDSTWNYTGGSAAAAAYDGSDRVYLLGADNGSFSIFSEYSLSRRTTSYLPTPPFVGQGGAMAYSNGFIYYLPAQGTRTLYRFDLAEKLWVQMADAPATLYQAGPSTFIRIGSALYAARGNDSAFYKYVPDSGKGTWTTMTAMPGSMRNGSMVWDGGNYVYALRANGYATFYRYDIAANKWSSMANLPETSSYGSAMVYSEGKIYATSGNWRTTMWTYDVAGNAWSAANAAPEGFRTSSFMVKVDERNVLVNPGDDSPDLLNLYLPTPTTGYLSKAVHVGQAQEIQGLFDYAGIAAQVDIPQGTSIDFYTRTSPDGVAWDPWLLVNDVKRVGGQFQANIASKPQRFIQTKVQLVSDTNVSTPKLYDYTLHYYFDVSAPTNPTVASYYSDLTKGTAITTSTWYNHPKPFFDWPEPGETNGATDQDYGSGIKGYHVYFGKDRTAMPVTDGTFVTRSEFEADLDKAGIYYLRIQTEDVTNNVSSEVYAPFIYQFDNIAPLNPTLITVNPSGYSPTNSFTFNWTDAVDPSDGANTSSGIKEYCYRTGATTGEWAQERCQTVRNLTDVAAMYTNGANAFYVRTKDNAGNFSVGSAQATYYYSREAPSRPEELTAIPPSNNQNLFSFTWQPPLRFSGDKNQLQYCYSVNVKPSVDNVKCTRDLYVPPFKAATVKGTNVFYVVAMDESNNVEWANYAQRNFSTDWTAPGRPNNLVGSDTSDKLKNRWAVTLTWDAPVMVGNGIDHYVIERSEDAITFKEAGRTTNQAFVDLQVEANTAYTYQVRASDAVDNLGDSSSAVEVIPKGQFTEPPDRVKDPEVKSGATDATVTWVTSRECAAKVFYGSRPDNLNRKVESSDLTTVHTLKMDGLDPLQTYYYKVESYDLERSYEEVKGLSGGYQFATTDSARISKVSVQDITTKSAYLTWSSSVPVKSVLYYYPSSSKYEQHADADTDPTQSHQLRLADLAPGTTYRYRISSTAVGGEAVTSDEYQFTTVPLPSVSNVRFQRLTNEIQPGVIVSWTTNVPTDSVVKYRLDATEKEVGDSEYVTEHVVTINGLANNAEYEISLKGRDTYGNQTEPSQHRWHSDIDTRPPQVKNLTVDVAMTGGWGGIKAVAIISWETDEPSTTQVMYGSGMDLSKKTTENKEVTTSHTVVVPNLDLAKVYRVQVVGSDLAGNRGLSEQAVIVTPRKENSVFDILNGLFGSFMRRI